MATDGDLIDRWANTLADDIERYMNTGHRVYAVDRTAFKSAYRTAHSQTIAANHDPGDEDRSER